MAFVSAPKSVVFESTAEVFEDHHANIPPPSADSPQVLFRTSLVLSREKEDLLCSHARRWYERLDESMGREDTSLAGVDSMGAFFTNLLSNVSQRGERRFFEKRLLYQRIAENNMDHRAEMYPDSIFGKSNLVVPLARRIQTQLGGERSVQHHQMRFCCRRRRRELVHPLQVPRERVVQHPIERHA